MNKKLIIGIILLIIMGIIIFIFSYYKCEETESGWKCYLLDKVAMFYEKKCKQDQGRWSHPGMHRLSSNDYFCDIPFEDAGKKCLSSEECTGTCVATEDFLEKNSYAEAFSNVDCIGFCEGECSAYPMRCDWHYEIDNGKIINHTEIYCD